MDPKAPTPSTPRFAGGPLRGWQRFSGGAFAEGTDPFSARTLPARTFPARTVSPATAVDLDPPAADMIRALGPVAAIFGVLVLEILGVLVRQGAAAG